MFTVNRFTTSRIFFFDHVCLISPINMGTNGHLSYLLSNNLYFRLPGGVDEKRHDPNDDVELTNEPDMIT